MTHSALGSTARFAFTQACKDGMRLNLRRSAEDVCLQAAPISTSALHSELQCDRLAAFFGPKMASSSDQYPSDIGSIVLTDQIWSSPPSVIGFAPQRALAVTNYLKTLNYNKMWCQVLWSALLEVTVSKNGQATAGASSGFVQERNAYMACLLTPADAGFLRSYSLGGFLRLHVLCQWGSDQIGISIIWGIDDDINSEKSSETGVVELGAFGFRGHSEGVNGSLTTWTGGLPTKDDVVGNRGKTVQWGSWFLTTCYQSRAAQMNQPPNSSRNRN
ncbi:hypothetical protein V8E55_007647 [Tylopilus felleus]